MRLLVVNFDFLFPRVERPWDEAFPGEAALYDWGHTEEAPFLYEAVWPSRAAGFLAAGQPLPMVPEHLLATFWGGVRLAPRASLFYADTSALGIYDRVRRYVDEVWLLSAFHSAGARFDSLERARATGRVTCEDWMLGYVERGITAHMRYPRWRSYALESEPVFPYAAALDRAVYDPYEPLPVFDRVFVPRSPGWVPPWCDRQFEEFLLAAPVRRAPVNMADLRLRRRFSLDDADRVLAATGGAS